MKASLCATRRGPSKRKKRIRAQSTHLYRAHKEVGQSGMRIADFLSSRLGVPRPVVLRLVGSEVSRLSTANKLKVITVHEISAAVALVRRRIRTRAAA